MPDFSRRQLISTGVVGLSSLAFVSACTIGREDWDLIVIGAGTAGIPAATFAAARGARVLLLERDARTGGTLWYSGGQMSAAGTRRQKALGITDTPEQHFNDIMRISRGTANADIVRRAVAEAGATVDWLDDHGFDFADRYPMDATGHEPYSQRRIWGGKDGGRSLMQTLEKAGAAVSSKPTLKTEFEVTELMLGAQGEVTGVRGRDSGGKPQEFRSRHVVMASGGYMSNPKRFAELTGVPLYRTGWSSTNDGIGITLALQAGGYVRGKENYLCDFGSVPSDLEQPSIPFASFVHYPQRRAPWEIWVNRNGERFVREDEPSIDNRERALLAQPDHRLWIVFDQRMLDNAPALLSSGGSGPWSRDNLRAAFGQYPSFAKGNTIDELAKAAGIDAPGLRSSIAGYNAAAASGSDRLGRKVFHGPIAQGPFYAIRSQGSSLISAAGVAADGELRVTRPSGEPIKGLYAVGELLGFGSLMGKAYCSGMMVTPALSLGRYLGRTLPIV